MFTQTKRDTLSSRIPNWRDHPDVRRIDAQVAADRDRQRALADKLTAARRELGAAEDGMAAARETYRPAAASSPDSGLGVAASRVKAARAAVQAIEEELSAGAGLNHQEARAVIQRAQRQAAEPILAGGHAAFEAMLPIVRALVDAAALVEEYADLRLAYFDQLAVDPIGDPVGSCASKVPENARHSFTPLPNEVLSRLRIWLRVLERDSRSAA